MVSIQFVGNLVRDPEIKQYTKNGEKHQFTSFYVGAAGGKRDANGRPIPVFINCAARGKVGETIANAFKKGDRIAIFGEVSETRAWIQEGKDPGSELRVQVQSFEFCQRSGNAQSTEQS